MKICLKKFQTGDIPKAISTWIPVEISQVIVQKNLEPITFQRIKK